jgi:glycosyltransferase involved in cell wall biosynthesis
VIKHLIGRPVVLDFRDPWALNPHANHGRGQKRILGWLEAWAVRTCDALILNTQGAERLYRRRYAAHAHKMSCVPNGFDRLNVQDAVEPAGRFTIMHVGDFYRSRTPARPLEALASLDNDAIEFVQVGPWCEVFARYEGRVRIRHIDRVTHGEALGLMRTASVLYLAQGWEEGVSEYVSVASKTYEYLATGTPILADVPPGDNADVIQGYAHRAWVVTSRSVEALASAIAQAYASRGDLERRVIPAFERTFNRRRQAAILASVLDTVAAPRERDVPRERWNGVAPRQPASVEPPIQVDGYTGY